MISLLAAISKNNCIGKDGEIPWHIPEDMKRVKELTTGKVIVMGRKTWESIPEKRRPLPNRTNVVITRDTEYALPEGVFRYSSVEEAIEAHNTEDIVGFGGQGIYEAMLPYAKQLDICHVDNIVEGCTASFPPIDPTLWKEVWREDHDGYAFVTYRK